MHVMIRLMELETQMNRYKTLLRKTIEFRCCKCYKRFRNSLEEFEEHVRKGSC